MKRSAQTLYGMAFTLAAAVTIAAYAPGGAAQPARVKPAAGEDLRAVFATPVEVAEGGRLAEASCARCHGANGISTIRGVPHLAGQRAAYLHLQLRAYQQTARVQTAMTGIVKFLSDDALLRVAAYYASLDSPRPVVVKSPAKPAPDPAQAGEAAAAGCAGCHGEGGVSRTPGMPSLVGFEPKSFIAAMNAYKSGQRKHDLMKSLAAGLSDADLNNLALYYALQKPARAQTPAPGDPAAGKKAAAACAACHGEQGVSGNPATPNLAGQDAQYLAAALRAYKDGSRTDQSMTAPAAALDEKTITDLAAFYAAQPPQPPNVRRPLSTAEWAERCDRCHGVNGNSTDPLVPALAAQRADWMENVLNAYRKGARKSPAMSAMSMQLSEADVRNLAAHYARQTARSVVYVPLPGRAGDGMSGP
jgi:cytochrome c553